MKSVCYHKLLFYSVDISLQCLDDTGRLVELISETLFHFGVFLLLYFVLPHNAVEGDKDNYVCDQEADDDEN